MIVALGAMIAVVVIPFILIASPRRRPAFTAWWLASLCFLSLFLGGFILGKKIRTSAFHNLAERSETLVSAIRQYTDHGGSPPKSLEDLVPTYLSQVPETGIMAYPDYRYEVGDAAQRYEGNPWVLRVSTPSGGINFDEFLYFPRRNYPSHGYGGSIERIGEWAYLHE